MKARIENNGTLVVSPENPTEAFALQCWWRGYIGEGGGHIDVALEVEARVPEPMEAPEGDRQ